MNIEDARERAIRMIAVLRRFHRTMAAPGVIPPQYRGAKVKITLELLIVLADAVDVQIKLIDKHTGKEVFMPRIPGSLDLSAMAKGFDEKQKRDEKQLLDDD